MTAIANEKTLQKKKNLKSLKKITTILQLESCNKGFVWQSKVENGFTGCWFLVDNFTGYNCLRESIVYF